MAVLPGRDHGRTRPLRRRRLPPRPGSRSLLHPPSARLPRPRRRRRLPGSKLAFVDTGVATHLIGQDAARLGEPGGAAGPILENFVNMALARQLTWSDTRARQYHYRTKDKIEVDVVLETPDGRIVGVEVKAGATVRTEDLTGLRNLASQAGDRFVAGIVLYTGPHTLPFGDRIRALPMNAMWRLTL